MLATFICTKLAQFMTILRLKIEMKLQIPYELNLLHLTQYGTHSF